MSTLFSLDTLARIVELGTNDLGLLVNSNSAVMDALALNLERVSFLGSHGDHLCNDADLAEYERAHADVFKHFGRLSMLRHVDVVCCLCPASTFLLKPSTMAAVLDSSIETVRVVACARYDLPDHDAAVKMCSLLAEQRRNRNLKLRKVVIVCDESIHLDLEGGDGHDDGEGEGGEGEGSAGRAVSTRTTAAAAAAAKKAAEEKFKAVQALFLAIGVQVVKTC